MEQQESNNKKKIGVIVTFISLIVTVIIFEYFKINKENNYFIVIELSAITIFLLSFIFAFVKTGLWKFTHKPLKELDEREIALTSKSLRYAYSIFTVTALIFLLIFAIMKIQIDMVLVVSLIIFAHLLPASVIALSEKSENNY